MVMKLKRKYQTSNIYKTMGVAVKKLPHLCFISVWFVFFYVFYYMSFICVLTACIVFPLVLYRNTAINA